MKMFKITYTDPKTEEIKTEIVEFDDFCGKATYKNKAVGAVMNISAKEWAEDCAYSLADKGHYEIEEIFK